MENYKEHIEYLEIQLKEELDYTETCLYFLMHLGMDEDFKSLCHTHVDLKMRHFIQVMAERQDPTYSIPFSRMEMFRHAKFDFVYGNAQTKDKSIVAIFFLIEKSSVGLLQCTNVTTGRTICGKFQLAPTQDIPPFEGEEFVHPN